MRLKCDIYKYSLASNSRERELFHTITHPNTLVAEDSKYKLLTSSTTERKFLVPTRDM